jgi:hypothetical protein
MVWNHKMYLDRPLLVKRYDKQHDDTQNHDTQNHDFTYNCKKVNKKPSSCITGEEELSFQ